MAYADRVKETTTTTGTGPLALGGAAAGFQTFAAGFTVGATLPYCIVDASGNWETGIGTLTGATTLTRGVVKSSNGGSLVNFGAGSKDVFCTPLASQLSAFQVSQDIAFATAIPLTVAGTQYMPQQTVASVLAFTVAASPVKGASVYVRLIADGTNAPTFGTMKEWGGSLGYDNRNGIANQVQFFNDGYDTFYSISQVVSAVAVVPAPGQVTGLLAGTPTNSAVPLTWSLPSGGTPTDYIVEYKLTSSGTWLPFTDGTSTALSATVTGLAASSAYDFRVSATNTGGTGAVSATASATTAAAATAPATMAAPTATAGDASAVVTLTAPSNGGSAITGYTVTSIPAGGVDSNAGSTSLTHTMTGLTNGTAYTFTAKATNAVGTAAAASPASNSVTPAGASTVRMTGSKSAGVAESASAPWTYTDAGGATGSSGVKTTTALPSNTNGVAIFKMLTPSNDFMVGVSSSAAVTSYSAGNELPLWVSGGKYKSLGPDNTTTTVTVEANDLVRLTITGVAAADYLVPYKFEYSKDNGSTWALLAQSTAGVNGLRTIPYYLVIRPGSNSVHSLLSATGWV